MVRGRDAIGKRFEKALMPPVIVVGDAVNVAWRAETPFFAEPYHGPEAFETKNGLLVAPVTTCNLGRDQDEEAGAADCRSG
jgi:hypothetical protein